MQGEFKKWPPQDITQKFQIGEDKKAHYPPLNYLSSQDGQEYIVWWYGPDGIDDISKLRKNFKRKISREVYADDILKILNQEGELEYKPWEKDSSGKARIRIFKKGDIILKGNYEDLKSRLEQIAKSEAEKEKNKCLIVAMGKDTEAIEISERLYKEGIKNYILFGKVIRPEPIEHAKSYAKFNNFPYIIFLEQDNNRYKFIEMKTGKEERLKEKEIFNKLK